MYRIVAADSAAPRDGRFIETLGHYHPLTHPATVVVNRARVEHWMKHGAQPTAVVQRLLKRVEAAAEPKPAVAAPTRVRRTRAAAVTPSETPETPPAAESAHEAPEGTQAES